MGKDKGKAGSYLKNFSIKKILVVSGGMSGERAVSLSSGKECSRALRAIGYHVEELEFSSLEKFISQVSIFQPDVIFNALHGLWGEGGPFQGILDTIEIPYTHSGLLPSAMAMNKDLTKKILNTEGIPTPPGCLITGKDLSKVNLEGIKNFPCVIKPNNEGSSIGVEIIKNSEALLDLLNSEKGKANTRNESKTYLVEEYIPGRELTTAIVDNKPLGVTEIITDNWYDYSAKYDVGGSNHVFPANIPNSISDLCKDYALSTHFLLGCKGVSRVDFRWNDSLGKDGLFVLEINTQPGMTPTSLVPEQASASGISFEELCCWIVEDASCYR